MTDNAMTRQPILHRSIHSPTHQRGFTLIEVLVAVLVLSIGLLGLAALQTSGLGMNHSAYLRSQATILAADMADRMRANQDAVDADKYNGTANAHAGCSTTGGCSSTQMAENDVDQWRTNITAALPEGTGIVCPDSSPNDGTDITAANNGCEATGNVYAVKIWWRDDRNTVSAATNCDGSVNATGMQCFVVSFQP